MTKVCKACKRRLPATAFYRSRITDDGLYWHQRVWNELRAREGRERA